MNKEEKEKEIEQLFKPIGGGNAVYSFPKKFPKRTSAKRKKGKKK